MAQVLIDNQSKNKKSVVVIKNRELSGWIAIGMGVKHHEWGVRKNSQMNCWQNLIRREVAQRKCAEEVVNGLGLQESLNKLLDNELLLKIDAELKEFQLIVVERLSKDLYFFGTHREKVICLEKCGNGFNFIKDIESYFGRKFCRICKRCFDRRVTHRCTASIYSEPLVTQCSDGTDSQPMVTESSDGLDLPQLVTECTPVPDSAPMETEDSDVIDSPLMTEDSEGSDLQRVSNEPIVSERRPHLNPVIANKLVDYSDSESDDSSDEQIGGSNVISKWDLIEENLIQKNGFNIMKVKFDVTHNFDINRIQEYKDAINDAFEEAIWPLVTRFGSVEYFSLSLDCNGLSPPIFIPPMKMNTFDKNAFLFSVLKVEQSNKEFLMSGVFDVTLNVYLSRKRKLN